jgi:hypothetical protein
MSIEAMKDMIKWDRPCYKCLSHYCDLSCKETLKQEHSEPVAVVDVHEFYDNCANFSLLQKLSKGKHTLYTTPQQRTWVGLNNEERLKLYRQFEDCLESDGWEYEKAIESELMRKNI